MDLKELGGNIASVRRSKGLTQEDVAFDLDISSTSYAKIERGETNVPFLRLVQIADYFKIDITLLFGKREEQPDCTLLKSDIDYIKQKVDCIASAIQKQKL